MKCQMGVSHSFLLEEMTAADLHPVEIATGLARINRYGGQGRFPLSVAQHSVILSCIVPDRIALAALTHDVPEIWIGDMLGPAKRECEGYDALEERFIRKLGKCLGVPYEQFLEVQPWDKRICNDERKALFSNCNIDPKQLLGVPVEEWSVDKARDYWLQRWGFLMAGGRDAA